MDDSILMAMLSANRDQRETRGLWLVLADKASDNLAQVPALPSSSCSVVSLENFDLPRMCMNQCANIGLVINV
jgi:hypothetical protein